MKEMHLQRLPPEIGFLIVLMFFVKMSQVDYRSSLIYNLVATILLFFQMKLVL